MARHSADEPADEAPEIKLRHVWHVVNRLKDTDMRFGTFFVIVVLLVIAVGGFFTALKLYEIFKI